MADWDHRWPDNEIDYSCHEEVFYVDRGCLFCSICSEIAPRHFAASVASGVKFHAVCIRQPSNDGELALCEKARERCPYGAIGRTRSR